MAKAKRRNFKLTLKVAVIKYAEAESITKAADRFQIDRKTIRYWISNKVSFSQ